MRRPSVVAIGAVNWDVTLFVPHLPADGEEVTVSRVARVPGGTGANVAVAAARILPPGETGFVGALGADSIGDDQLHVLEAEGVATGGVAVLPEHESGQAFIMVDDQGQNVIASAFGANAALTPYHLRQPAVREMIAGARVCAVTDPPLDVVEELLTMASADGPRVSWDPGVLVVHGRNALAGLAMRVDTLLLNEIEAVDLIGESDPAAAARRLRGAGWRNHVILKRGSEGAIWLDLSAGTITEVPPLPLAELGLSVASTVGAGDAFHGALVALNAAGWAAPDVRVGAVCAAGLKVTRPGARDAPSLPDIERAVAAWRRLGQAARTGTL